MTTKFVAEVKYDDEQDDYYIEFNEEIASELGWKPGDSLEWIDNQDGTYTIRKKYE